MKERSKKTELKLPDNPTLTVGNQLLSLARIIRRRGTPAEAQIAAAWEQIIQRAIEEGQLPKAA